MEVGDVVVRRGDRDFESGGESYPCAIVACVDPFVMVSIDGASIWINDASREDVVTDIVPEDVVVVCQAAAHLVGRAKRCWEQYRPIQEVQPEPKLDELSVLRARWNYIKTDIEGARALLLLLQHGKGSGDDFDTMVDRIILSKKAAEGRPV